MGTPEEAVRGLLMAHTPLIELVGERITPQINTDEPVFPLITYERSGLEKQPKLGGAQKTSKVLVDVTTYADTEAACGAVAIETVNALNGKRDLTQKVMGIFHADSQAGLTEDGKRFMQHTFAVWHTEA